MKQQPFIYNFNYLSRKPSLYILGNDKLNTKCGIVMSLLFLFISLAFAIYSLYSFFDRNQAQLMYWKNSFPTQEYNLSDSFFVVGLFGNFTQKQALAGATYIQTVADQVSYFPIHMEKCNLNTNIPNKYSHLFQDNLITSYHCLVPGQNIILKDDPEMKTRYTIQFYLLLCDEEQFGIPCDTPETIEEQLRKSSQYVTLQLESNSIDHYSKGNPFTPIISEINVEPNYDYLITENLYWSVYNYSSDEGWMFERKKHYQAVVVNEGYSNIRTEPRTKYDTKNPLLTVELGLYPYSSERFIRTYKRIQSVFADIWGIMFLLEAICKFIIHFFVGKMYYTSILQNVFEDATIYKNNQFNKIICKEDRMKVTNNSSQICPSTTEVSNIQLVKIEKTSKKVSNHLFGTKESSNLTRTNNKVKNEESSTRRIFKNVNCYTQLKLCDFIISNFSCLYTKNKIIVDLSEKYIRSYLSCEQSIKNRININKVSKIITEEIKGQQLNQIKPDFIREMEQNKVLTKYT